MKHSGKRATRVVQRPCGLEPVVNVEQASKRLKGGRVYLGERATSTPRSLIGVVTLARMEDQERCNTSPPIGADAQGNRNLVRDRLG